MADEKKEKKKPVGNTFEDIALVVIIVIALFGFFSKSSFFSSLGAYGNLLTPGNIFSGYQIPIGAMISGPLGSLAKLLNPAPFFESVGGALKGTKQAGDTATVIGGPEFKDGKRYWLVQFADGSTGWVAEDSLGNSTNGALNAGDTPVGRNIVTNDSTPLFSTPGGASTGSEKSGSAGTVTKGPVYANGERYWFVEFGDGTSGWVPEKNLGDIGPAPFLAGETPVGSRAITHGKTAVRSSAGGPIVEYQPDGSPGVITKGPVALNGTNYYYVDFEHGTDGFVAEGDITDEVGTPVHTGVTATNSTAVLPWDTNVLSEPGGQSAGVQKKGAAGTIVGTPVYVNGVRYWYVDFPNGPDGYVPESGLRGAKVVPFNPGTTIVGETIYAGSRIPVYNAPAGEIIGYQKAGARGVVIQGPVYFNGTRYWAVDFDTGVDGYIAGGDMRVAANHPVLATVNSIFKNIGILLSLVLVTAIVYVMIRHGQVHAEYHHRIHIEEAKTRVQTEMPHPRWEKVLSHLSAENPNEWRLAILEADIILAEMLEKMHYGVGETIGDRLKSIEESDFHTVDMAWEAHKARNMIAHEGSDFVLTQREAKRIIGLYEKVFHEFRYI